MHIDGSPRPDGIPIYFYHKFWGCVKYDLVKLMEDYHGGANLNPINFVGLFQVLKMGGAAEIGDFGPINLAKRTYQIILMVMANCLRNTVGMMVNESPGAHEGQIYS